MIILFAEKHEAKKKEELIKLRLAANGGKANKKIAKHFGADVIDLQAWIHTSPVSCFHPGLAGQVRPG